MTSNTTSMDAYNNYDAYIIGTNWYVLYENNSIGVKTVSNRRKTNF